MVLVIELRWNPSVTDAIGNQNFVRYSKVSLTQRLPIYFRYRRGMRNPVVEYNVAAFSELSFAEHW